MNEVMTARRTKAKQLFDSAGLYCLTDSELSQGRDNLYIVSQMVTAGARIVQYREKNKSQLAMYRECMAIRELTRGTKTAFFVNDDIALAIAVSADGIHVGQEDLPVPIVRQIVGESMLIGLSTHSPQQAQLAGELGADYIGVGPVYQTLTKKDVGDPVGLDYVDYVAQNLVLPFVAIGGINSTNVQEVVLHGANCVAMISDIVSAADIREKVHEVLNQIQVAKAMRG
jgi:thiamine-phosphate pyrophosphorylase